MEALIKHAAIAWNPVHATRLRLANNTLTVGSVLLPFLAVVIACNLVTVSAQKFFLDSLVFALNTEIPEHPLLGDFSMKVLAALSPLITSAVVAMLPARAFGSVGRSAVVSSMFIVAASWAFYGAVIATPIWYVSGVLVTGDIELGLSVVEYLQYPAVLLIFLITCGFWFLVFRRVLELPWPSFALITILTLGTLLVVFTLAWVGFSQLLD